MLNIMKKLGCYNDIEAEIHFDKGFVLGDITAVTMMDCTGRILDIFREKYRYKPYYLGLPQWYVIFVLKYFKWML